MEDTLVPCQRCGSDGGKVFYGWALLCQKCQDNDLNELFDDKGES